MNINGEVLVQNILTLAVLVFVGYVIWIKVNKQKLNVGFDFIKNIIGRK